MSFVMKSERKVLSCTVSEGFDVANHSDLVIAVVNLKKPTVPP
jgi:hypothetical protein